MFICHACGNCTRPREQRTVLPVYYAGRPLQIKREVWLCPQCAKFVNEGNSTEWMRLDRLDYIVCERIKRESTQFLIDELERIGEENYRRERDRMRADSQSKGIHRRLSVELPAQIEDSMDTPPVKPRGSYQPTADEGLPGK